MDELTLAVAGTLAAVAPWRVVAVRRVSVWAVMPATMGVLGGLSLLVGDPAMARRAAASTAALVGVGSGVALYLATIAFVWVVRDWTLFRRHAAAIYDLRGGLSLVAALALGVGVVATGEELFWRGLVHGRLAELDALGRTGGAVVTWLVYIGVNVASGSLALIAGGIVAGGVWTLLAWWSGGVLASLCCHAVWTGLMVSFPPSVVRDGSEG